MYWFHPDLWRWSDVYCFLSGPEDCSKHGRSGSGIVTCAFACQLSNLDPMLELIGSAMTSSASQNQGLRSGSASFQHLPEILGYATQQGVGQILQRTFFTLKLVTSRCHRMYHQMLCNRWHFSVGFEGRGKRAASVMCARCSISSQMQERIKTFDVVVFQTSPILCSRA